ncbi:MAG TPA: MFS transporter [Rubrobacteraceae bacterium]
MLLCQHLGWDPWDRRFAEEEGAARGRSVSRLNVLIAITAAIIGLIYGYDLGSIASALLFLVPAFDLNTFMTSVVTSAVVLGQLFGGLFAGRISNTIGRKLGFPRLLTRRFVRRCRVILRDDPGEGTARNTTAWC